MIEINYLAVLVAALAQNVIGMLWYGPLFGKQWTALMGISPKEVEEAKKKGMKSMAKELAISFASGLLMAYVLIYFIQGWAQSDATVSGLSAGLQSGFWLWLGLIATSMIHRVLWEGSSKKLYYLNTFYWLAVMLCMGAILGAWV